MDTDNDELKRKKKLSNKLLVLTIAIIVVVGILYSYIGHVILENEGVYSIATITKVEGARGGAKVNFSFSYDHTIYTNSGIFPIPQIMKSDVGKIFLVKIIPKHPHLAFYIYFKVKIPDSVKVIPDTGWSKLPDWAIDSTTGKLAE